MSAGSSSQPASVIPSSNFDPSAYAVSQPQQTSIVPPHSSYLATSASITYQPTSIVTEDTSGRSAYTGDTFHPTSIFAANSGTTEAYADQMYRSTSIASAGTSGPSAGAGYVSQPTTTLPPRFPALSTYASPTYQRTSVVASGIPSLSTRAHTVSQPTNVFVDSNSGRDTYAGQSSHAPTFPTYETPSDVIGSTPSPITSTYSDPTYQPTNVVLSGTPMYSNSPSAWGYSEPLGPASLTLAQHIDSRQHMRLNRGMYQINSIFRSYLKFLCLVHVRTIPS